MMQGAILRFSVSPPRLPSTMGLRSYLFIFLVILLASSLTVSLSQPLHSDPIFAQPPTSSLESDATAALSRTSAALRRHHFRGILLGLVLGSLTGFLASLLFIFSLRHCLFYASRSPVLTGPVVFTPDINPSDLCAALSAGDPHPTQLIGSGPSGKYYRVELQGGLVQLAVKTIEPNCPECSPAAPTSHRRKPTRRHRRVQQGLELLGAVRHRNVMPLRAYHHHLDEQHGSGRHYLAYDYMPHGSLDDALRQHRGDGRSRELVAAAARLGWAARHRIAVGVAKGLRHLHFECSPRILHCRLKPANVVLDEEMEPRLTDCGLGRLHLLVAGDDDADGGTGFVGSYSSYTAPECFQNLRYTDKSDIFSFGVTLGVLLTGRDPSDPFFGGELGSFVRWLRHVQQQQQQGGGGGGGGAKEALDRSILGDEAEEEEMLMAVRIAVVCVSDSPADRPSSDELVAMLTQLHSF